MATWIWNVWTFFTLYIFVYIYIYIYIYIKVKWSRYRPCVAQRLGRGIALLFHDRGTRRGWVVSSTPRLHFTLGKDPVSVLQEAGWTTWPVWLGGKSRPHRDSIPDRPARSQSLYGHTHAHTHTHTHIYMYLYILIPFYFVRNWLYYVLCVSELLTQAVRSHTCI